MQTQLGPWGMHSRCSTMLAEGESARVRMRVAFGLDVIPVKFKIPERQFCLNAEAPDFFDD